MNLLHESRVETSGCLYGTADRRNRALFGYQLFQLILSTSMFILLFDSQKLRRLYLPLYYIVNCILPLQGAASILYFCYFPYADNEGNCSELFIGRAFIGLTMFGELHQTYFVANFLGVGNTRFHFGWLSLSFEKVLQIASLLVCGSFITSLFIRKIFMISRNSWTLFISLLQIYLIRRARHVRTEQLPLDAIVDVENDAVSILESLSWLQVFPTLATLTDRVFEYYGLGLIVSVDEIMLILESVVNLLFMIKVLIIQEKANKMTVEVHSDGRRGV
jgi:hypothetical protein